jgi:hypothetical protein
VGRERLLAAGAAPSKIWSTISAFGPFILGVVVAGLVLVDDDDDDDGLFNFIHKATRQLTNSLTWLEPMDRYSNERMNEWMNG